MLRYSSALLILFLLFLPFAASALTIAGTGDSELLLRRLSEDFMQRNPGVGVHVPPSVGSSGGIRLLLQGRTDLARVARRLSPDEEQKGLVWYPFARVPVIFVANLESHCVSGLQSSQVIDIFRGKISLWSQLGDCPNEKIYLARRESGDSSNRVLEEKIKGLKGLSSLKGKVLYTTSEAFETVASTPGTLGYLPKTQLDTDHLRILSFNGVRPAAEKVLSGDYPLQLPLALVWREPLLPAAKRFIEYLDSSAARTIIEQLGAVAVTGRGTAN